MVENSYSPDKNSKRGRTNTLLNKMVMPAFIRPRSPARKRALSAISLSRSFGNFIYFFSLLPLHRSSRPEVFCKKGILKKFAKSQETPVPASDLQLYYKDSGTSEFCEIFKNTYFYRSPLVAASNYMKNAITFKGFFSIHKQICICLWIRHTY